MTSRTLEHLKERFVEDGLAAALRRKQWLEPSRKVRFDGDFEARLVALARSAAPEGRKRWTVRLLAEKLVELRVVAAVSAMTVCNTLKKLALHALGLFPQRLSIKELQHGARASLRRDRWSEAMTAQEERIAGPSPWRATDLASLLDRFRQLRDGRSGHGLRHRQPFVLACAAVAVLMRAGRRAAGGRRQDLARQQANRPAYRTGRRQIAGRSRTDCL